MPPASTTAPSKARQGSNQPHSETPEALLGQFGSHPDRGLEAAEVARRQERHGWNELPELPGQPAWLKLLLQFHQPLIYILLAAGLVKALLATG